MKPNGENETWRETVDRVVDGNCDLVDPEYITSTERDRLREMIYDFKIMPAGRHLWVSGVPGRQFIFNCHRAGFTQNLRDHCDFLFYELMKGGGVGANYSIDYIYRVGSVSLYFTDKNSESSTAITVDDSKEGWVDILGTLLDLHQEAGNTGSYQNLEVNLSKIRAKGEPIVGFGGISAGPECLQLLLTSVNDFLNEKAYSENEVLSGLDLMTLDHYIAQAVISGNTRRSARMSIMRWDDPEIFEFIKCKEDPEMHWTTNISVELDRYFFKRYTEELSEYKLRLLNEIANGMMKNGEPGIFNSYLASQGEYADVSSTNPCGEIALEEFENCNLGHLNLALLDESEVEEAAWLMSRFLYRATFSPDITHRQTEGA